MKRFVYAALIALVPAIVFAQGRSYGSTVSVTNDPAVNVDGGTVAITNDPAVNIDGGTLSVTNRPDVNVTNRVIILDSRMAVPAGLMTGQSGVNKFGRSKNVDAVITDIWDGANSTTDQDIWIAPTAARIHNIASTVAADSNSAAGARTLQVYGLTNWANAEVSETITMLGTNVVSTTNAYVILHRMKVLTKGTTNNVGNITATAASDDTLTAMILAGEGQTQMAIYGIPSSQTAYMTCYYSSFNRSGGAAALADISLQVNPEPDASLPAFLVKQTQGLQTVGSSLFQHCFNPYFKIVGPAIVKIQAIGSTTDLDISAGFDLVLVDN